MKVLNNSEIESVSGGDWDSFGGAALTVGLMALAPASLVVIGVGVVALGAYAYMSL